VAILIEAFRLATLGTKAFDNAAVMLDQADEHIASDWQDPVFVES
jgi:hypothetical protein